jgi:hypothetical protein
MLKSCFAWGFALVMTLGLLGVSLAGPTAGAVVTDDEAAQLVGGQEGCPSWYVHQCYVDISGCGFTCYNTNGSGPMGKATATTQCGFTSGCTVCYNLGSCLP